MRNENGAFKNTSEDRPFLKPQKPLLSGWVGGWMGGDQKGPSIFLIFKYVNKQDALIPNLASKVVYDNYIKSYEQFKFENLKF